MDPLPPDVAARVSSLAGGAVALLYDNSSPRPRATLHFFPPGGSEIPLTVVVDGIREAAWGFDCFPTLRVPWRYAGSVRAVRFASVQSFDSPSGPSKAVRVEVDIDATPQLVLEGDSVTIGPVSAPPPTPNLLS
jgi:hypothetical protein